MKSETIQTLHANWARRCPAQGACTVQNFPLCRPVHLFLSGPILPLQHLLQLHRERLLAGAVLVFATSLALRVMKSRWAFRPTAPQRARPVTLAMLRVHASRCNAGGPWRARNAQSAALPPDRRSSPLTLWGSRQTSFSRVAIRRDPGSMRGRQTRFFR